jgi:hypothetical protein
MSRISIQNLVTSTVISRKRRGSLPPVCVVPGDLGTGVRDARVNHGSDPSARSSGRAPDLLSG